MGGDGIEDVVVACNSTKKIRNNSNSGITFGAPGGIICAKASMLLQVRVIIICVKALLVQSFHILYLEIKCESRNRCILHRAQVNK